MAATATLDLSDCRRLTKHGVEALLVGACGSLRGLKVAHNALLTDRLLFAMGAHCRS